MLKSKFFNSDSELEGKCLRNPPTVLWINSSTKEARDYLTLVGYRSRRPRARMRTGLGRVCQCSHGRSFGRQLFARERELPYRGDTIHAPFRCLEVGITYKSSSQHVPVRRSTDCFRAEFRLLSRSRIPALATLAFRVVHHVPWTATSAIWRTPPSESRT